MLIFLSSVFFSGIFLNIGIVPPVMKTPYGFVMILAPIPDTPREIPLYRETLRDGDQISLYLKNFTPPGQPLVSAEEAPALAQPIIDKNGGFPSDAGSPFAYSMIGKTIDGDTGKVLEEDPERTWVIYNRQIGDLPVLSDELIKVDFMANGAASLERKWRTLEKTGTNATFITSRQALEKMSRGEVLNPPMCCLNAFLVKNISLGYYDYRTSRTLNNPDIVEDPVVTLEPAWILGGSFPDGDPWDLHIDARK